MKHSFRSDVNNIKNLINEKYKYGLPLLKELIQNANDAGANNLVIGFHKQTNYFDNPLLNKCPAMFVINDSKFTTDNAYSIYQAAESSKNTEFTIGKFGLGLKCLYNYSEGYFYACSNVIIGKKQSDDYKSKIGLITPWETNDPDLKKENPYNDWWISFNNKDSRDSDYYKIAKIVNAHTKDFIQWFTLWIPLRTKELIIDKEYITDRFWDFDSFDFENKIITKNNIIKISQILPMMNSLNKITIIDSNNNSTIIEKISGKNLSLQHIKEQYINRDFSKLKNKTEIQISYNSKISKMNSILTHSIVDDEFVHNYVSEIKSNKNEKNIIPHYGILITENDEIRNSKMNFHHSCLLPLTKEDNQDVAKFNLFLHSIFFLDSSRSAPFFQNSEESSENVKKEIKWNKILKKHASRLIIPTISDFINKFNTSNKDISIISETINDLIGAKTLQQDDVCNDFFFLQRCLPNDKKWIKLSSEKTIYNISPGYLDFINHIHTFDEVLENFVFISGKRKNIYNCSIANWSEEFFISFFDIDFVELLSNKMFRDYWVFEINERITYLDDFSKDLIKKKYLHTIRAYLLNTMWEKIKESNSEINDILKLINDKIITLSFDTKATFETLNSTDIDLLIMPKKQNNYDNRLNDNDAISLLKMICEKKLTKRHKISSEIIAMSNYSRIKHKIVNLPIFEIECIENGKQYATIEDIQNKIIVDANSSNELVKVYTSAFQNITVYKFVFYKDLSCLKDYYPKVKPISLKFINDRIQNYGHHYNNYSNSKHLIYDFIKNYDPEYKEVIKRLFLAGNSEINLKVYIFRENNTYYKISREILRKNNGSYRIILDEDIKFFEEELQRELNIFLKDEIPMELFTLPMGNIDLSFLIDIEKESIYKQIEDNPKLLKLPIYATVDEEIVSLDYNNVFMLAENSDHIHLPPINNHIVIPFNEYIKRCNSIKVINSFYLIELYLESDNPYKYFKEILDRLSDINKSELDRNYLKVRTLLQTIKWIPSKNNKFYSLNKILFHYNYSEDFKNILSKCYKETGINSGFISSKSIDDKFLAHHNFKQIKELDLWNSDETIWTTISDLISKVPSLNIGKIKQLGLNENSSIFNTETNSDVEIIELIKKWKGNSAKKDYVNKYLIPSILNHNPSIDSQIKILSYIKQLSNSDKNILELHRSLLESYLNENQSIKLLNHISLLNQNNNWEIAEDLCFSTLSNYIPKNNILNEDYQKILNKFDFCILPETNLSICTEQPEEPEEIQQMYVENVRSYLNKYSLSSSSSNIIGIFLSLLADKDQRRVAIIGNYINSEIPVEDYRNEVIKDLKDKIDHFKSVIKSDDVVLKRMEKNKIKDFRVRKMSNNPFVDFQVDLRLSEMPSTFTAMSITGKLQNFEPKQTIISPEYKNPLLGYKFTYDFYNIDVDEEQFINLLKNAINQIITQVYLVDTAADFIENLWSKYENSSQLNIKISQERILNDLRFYFRRFKTVKENPLISDVIQRIEKLEHKKSINRLDGLYDDYSNEEKDIKYLLIEIINKPEIQKLTLDSVKNELKIAQYNEDSVLYELFQNADDAYKEKDSLGLQTKKYSYEVKLEDNHLIITHFGRNINQSTGNKISENEHYGFKNDLYKMLSLNYSDKNHSNVTGRFGLGFKSVYLICDDPTILSGDLCFKILGGIYPTEIDDDKKNILINDVTDKFRTTRFYLDLNKKYSDYDLITKFKKQAPLLPIFSKAIEKVSVDHYDYSWVKEKYYDELIVSSIEDYQVLVINSDQWKIVFKYSKSGFDSLKGFNKIWVTVPTDTETKYDLAINANFNIDIGRRQLAQEGNKDIFETISSEFSQILKKLFHSKMYPNEIDEFKFWNSLFVQLTKSNSEDKLHSIFWNPNVLSYYNLLKSYEILPNGLSNSFSALISLKNVKYRLSNELNKESKLNLLYGCGLPFDKCISDDNYKLLSRNIDIDIHEIITLDNYNKYINSEQKITQKDNLRIMEINLEGNRISEDPIKREKYIKEKVKQYEKFKEEQEWENAKFENQKKYSYGWFKCIVEASCNNAGDDQKHHSETVSFSKCEVNNAGNLITLKHPSRYLLQSYETSSNFIILDGENKKILDNQIRGVTLIENRAEIILIKKLNNNNIDDLITRDKIKLKFENYIDISQKLRDSFNSLSLAQNYCMRNTLTKNLHFVFGPPGTGKTFNIADKILKYQSDSNILVLAPTNKAADEIYLEVAEKQNSHKWMARFGNCNSPKIISEDQLLNSSNLYDNSISTIITTAIRFPYDGFRNSKFSETKWNYIIFDEASMISVQLITFIIHKANKVNPNCEFIIAGDPKQIPPIYNFTKPKDEEYKKEVENIENLIEGENIYTMVELDSFDKNFQNTKPYQYDIENLKEQYRSIKPIGEIFSKYAYNGFLTHKRNISDSAPINIPDIDLSNINIIDFPLLGGEIYHSRYIHNSHAHPYSSLFINEFLMKLDHSVNKSFTVGIISPYKPQVKMIEKLVGKHSFINLDIQVNTVHGFQGGQRDIIFCILNPPVNYTKGKEPSITCGARSLINKEFILNVAISRAKDYLFLLLPSRVYDSNGSLKNLTGFDNLKEINKLINIVEKNGYDYKHFQSSEIEKWCFNVKDFIYQNSNVISHDLVNVYQRSPKKYLVSHDEHSIDVQIKPDESN